MNVSGVEANSPVAVGRTRNHATPLCWRKSEVLLHVAWLSSVCVHPSPPSGPQPYWVPYGFPNWTFACTVPLVWNVLPSGLPAKLICQVSLSLDLAPGTFNPSLHLAPPSMVMIIVSMLSLMESLCSQEARSSLRVKSHHSSLRPQHRTPWIHVTEKWLLSTGFRRVWWQQKLRASVHQWTP